MISNNMESLSSTLLRLSKVSLVIPLGIVLILSSCGQWDDQDTISNPRGTSDGGIEIILDCRHEAILTYLVFNEYYESEICWGPSNIPDVYHAQSRAKIDGEWKWLKMSNGFAFTAHQDPFTVAIEDVGLQSALQWCGCGIYDY